MFTIGGKRILIAGLAVGAVLFAGGLFAYPLFFAHSSINGHSEKLGISGYGVVKAYHADGTLFASWEGHNSLSIAVKNAIAGCATGLSTTPFSFGSCSGWITDIRIDDTLGSPTYTIPATNTLQPVGCNPTTTPFCDSWKSNATFDSQITSPINVSTVSGKGANTFDILPVNPTIHLDPGDRLIVTITFTVA